MFKINYKGLFLAYINSRFDLPARFKVESELQAFKAEYLLANLEELTGIEGV